MTVESFEKWTALALDIILYALGSAKEADGQLRKEDIFLSIVKNTESFDNTKSWNRDEWSKLHYTLLNEWNKDSGFEKPDFTFRNFYREERQKLHEQTEDALNAQKILIDFDGKYLDANILYELLKKEPLPESIKKYIVMDESMYVNASKKNTSEKISDNSASAGSLKDKPSSSEIKEITNFTNTLYGSYQDKQKLYQRITEKVKGQYAAVNAIVEGYETCIMRQKNRTADDIKPLGVFTFVGAPGSGKTLLAKTFAEAIDWPVKFFNMAEFREDEDSASVLFGVDPSWKRAHAGELYNFIVRDKNAGHNIIVFDEIEKASLEVINFFHGMLEGEAQDKYGSGASLHGSRIPLKNSIIIFTSNAGHSLYEGRLENEPVPSKSLVIDALVKDIDPVTRRPYFPASIISRISSQTICFFRNVPKQEMIALAKSNLEKYKTDFYQKNNVRINFDDKLYYLIMLNKGGNLDARVFANSAVDIVKNEIYTLPSKAKQERISEALDERNEVSFGFDMKDESVKKFLMKFSGGNFKGTTLIAAANQGDLENKSFKIALDAKMENLYLNLDYKSYEVAPFGEALNIIKAKPDEKYTIIAAINLSYSNATTDFNTYNPLSAKEYLSFWNFIGKAKELRPNDSIVVTISNAETGTGSEKLLSNVKRSLLAAGVENVYFYDDDLNIKELSEKLYDGISKKNISKIMFDFERRNLRLDFNTIPKENPAGGIDILVRNIEEVTDISSSDSAFLIYGERMPKVSFSDVIGNESAKEELKFFLEYLKNPEQYAIRYKSVPKGVLLYGAPGTGKTYLAKALAHEAKVPFFTRNAADFVNRNRGNGIEELKKLFAVARKYSPSIIFIDEFDAVAQTRNGLDHYKGEVLNSLLSEMDGFDENRNKPVFVIAATNAAVDSDDEFSIDPAAVRRFTRKIKIELPNCEDRREYIRRELSKYKEISISSELIGQMAERCIGMNFSDISNTISLATRGIIKKISEGENVDIEKAFSDSIDTIFSGEEREISKEEIFSTAVHECGHALVSYLNKGTPPNYINIHSRGDYIGYVQNGIDDTKVSYTKAEVLGIVRMKLAGKAAEQLVLGSEKGANTGASADIKDASDLVRDMIIKYGMDEKIGFANQYNPENLPDKILDRIGEVLNDEYKNTMSILKENQDTLTKIYKFLIDKREMTGMEFEQIVKAEKGE